LLVIPPLFELMLHCLQHTTPKGALHSGTVGRRLASYFNTEVSSSQSVTATQGEKEEERLRPVRIMCALPPPPHSRDQVG
jgi:hypothetical protein